MVTVAIIDDGIGSGLYYTNDIVNSIEITSDLIVKSVDRCNLFNDSHGSICAAILSKYFSKATLTSIKILNVKNHKCKKEQLIKAIEWCVDNYIQVANLSLGTIDYRDFEIIKETINKAYNRGLIIVAACNNKDIFTFPASCSNVIGVKCSKNNVIREGKYIFNLYPIDGIEVIACSEHQLLRKGCDLKVTNKCNSYAAPMITAKVCKIINKSPNITLEEIKQNLYKNSINYIENTTRVNNYKNIDWVSNAALLVMNEKEYTFESSYINQIKSFKRIEDIKVDDFDTLILLNSIMIDCKKLEYIIYQFEKKEKSIVVIDDGCQDESYKGKYHDSIIKLWHPSIIKNFYEVSLPQQEIDVPLIIVYDDIESKMIKVLETLTAKFRSDGYYAVGALTKSIGALYGLEYIPVRNDKNFKEIKDKIEVLYKVYDFDILILGISINNEDISIIKQINMYVDPDKIIFCLDKFTDEIKTWVGKININDTLIVTPQNDIDLLYKKILNMFLCGNEKS